MEHTATFSELNKLKNIQHKLDHEQSQFLQILCKENPSLQDSIQKLNQESQTEWKTTRQDILNIHNKFATVKTKINFLDDSRPINYLKAELINLKEIIDSFKVKTQDTLHDLQKKEKKLMEDLTCCEQMYENWSKPLEIIEEPTFIKRITLSKIECPDVEEFEKFLHENKGHTNGWSWDDNAMFLKLKTKHKTIDKVTEHLHKAFPDKSVDEIEAHYRWHERYTQLRDKQRIAIQKWKAQKQIVDSSDILLSNCKADAKKKVKVAAVDPEETKAKLLAWKEEKRQRQEKEIEARETNEQFYKQLEITKNQKNSEVKERVIRWRKMKAAERRAIEAKRREEELKTRAFKAMLANHFIREFQSQDERFIKKMQACKTMKEKTSKTPHIVSKIVIARDPNRLLKPTKNWISKMERTKEEKLIQNAGYSRLNLNSIQKLKAPDWRKQIPDC